jgi:phosphoglycolate phosphatase
MDHLILFDVDGTLLTGGPAKEAFRLAMVRVYGTAGPIDAWEFSGKTDPQIARELLEAEGLEAGRIDEGMPALWRAYLVELERRLPAEPTRILPGVSELVEALEERGEVALGLVTGNVSRGAQLKLGAVGLAGRFPVGAFGSDHESRNELPGIALQRAHAEWGIRFEPTKVVVVGDTPRDVACGRHHGTRTVGVATGRFGPADLEEAGADAVLDDLGSTRQVLEVLFS